MSQVLGRLLLQLEANTTAFSRSLQDARKLAFDSSEAIVGSLSKIGTQLSKLKFDNEAQISKSFGIIGGVATAAAVGIASATLAIAKSVAGAGKELEKLAIS